MSNTSLKPYNTFAIEQSCRELKVAHTRQQLIHMALACYQQQSPLLVIGGGSNLVLLQDFLGTVIKIETQGIEVLETVEAYHLTVAAGVNWHELVKHTLDVKMPGLENLALIPGTVGAAPIQNIGAYGKEFCDVCEWVEYLDLDSGQLIKLSAEQCQFDYRDSIFKQELDNKAIIISVGIKLEKRWQPVLDYGPLQAFDTAQVEAEQIFDCVCQVRSSKLPDPKELGNAGSFFKNPIVEAAVYHELARQFSSIVGYALDDGRVKLAAGWLIEHAGLKGTRLGAAGIHKKQALVIVNLGGASGEDIAALAKHVILTVEDKFGVRLEIEPRLVANHGVIASIW
ncbi:UDP-N-acetylmuramate dehydrogenase [Shewanella sp. NIFS-20-20]|uniref:UDP-N-acetylmuramate dehydrogenase n=1 Tax=Shewanella sp. NIFS-20-20 TaxID=2853806 RepID=UPI001C477F1C|nr:UDP-N-acetylmuramate dehydrogenase [Shewanella sp. NIFS-20-20]MBV7316454.1 UDP-N-acetylmuramate dehydrogenase [Shewanella sp. NIFS-20-20]